MNARMQKKRTLVSYFELNFINLATLIKSEIKENLLNNN